VAIEEATGQRRLARSIRDENIAKPRDYKPLCCEVVGLLGCLCVRLEECTQWRARHVVSAGALASRMKDTLGAKGKHSNEYNILGCQRWRFVDFGGALQDNLPANTAERGMSSCTNFQGAYKKSHQTATGASITTPTTDFGTVRIYATSRLPCRLTFVRNVEAQRVGRNVYR
jgi:hypothetical protein